MEKFQEAGVALHPDDTAAVFEIYIKTTPERSVAGDHRQGDERAKYSFGVGTESEWTPGSHYRSSVPGVIDIAEGENLEVDPPRLLVQSFTALWSDEVKAEGTIAGHLGDRAGRRRLLPAHGRPTTSSRRAPTASCTAAGR